MFQRVRRFAEKCKARGIDILFNQKVIDSELAEVFLENEILALERFGNEGEKHYSCLHGIRNFESTV